MYTPVSVSLQKKKKAVTNETVVAYKSCAYWSEHLPLGLTRVRITHSHFMQVMGEENGDVSEAYIKMKYSDIHWIVTIQLLGCFSHYTCFSHYPQSFLFKVG